MKVSKEAVQKKIVEMLREVLKDQEASDINGSTHLNALGLNSFERVDLVLSLEKEYNIAIPDKLVFVFQTVEDVMSAILKAVGDKPDCRKKKIS
ncbi:MAG: acyl carrier protein [Peptococcaceae bacterium]|nr:acyl carrier protein [Peptococcaceae bacterium]